MVFLILAMCVVRFPAPQYFFLLLQNEQNTLFDLSVDVVPVGPAI